MIENAKFLGYYFYINLNIRTDFQICIGVPLRTSSLQNTSGLLNHIKRGSGQDP